MDAYIGQIYLFAFNWAPQDYALCQGQVMQVQQYAALYSLIGTFYGGNGSTNFNLPDLRSRVPRGWNPNLASLDTNVVGRAGGTITPTYPLAAAGQVTIAGASLPGHVHPASFSPSTGTQTVTIPASSGSGGISSTAGFEMVSGNTGINPVAGGSYYLAGVKGSSTGPCSAAAPTTSNKATVQGLSVTIDTSTYVPPTPSQSVSINTVTGGSVAVGSNNTPSSVNYPVTIAGNATGSANQLDPYLVINFSIAIQGLYPVRP